MPPSTRNPQTTPAERGVTARARFDVLLISDDAPDLPSRLAHVLMGCPPGRVAVQLRRPELGAGALYALAREVTEVCTAHGAPLLVNDRLDVALAVGADGAQLPERGLAPAVARRLLGHDALIGVSRHDAEGLADAQCASFALVSPIYDVPGKGSPIGLEGLRRVTAASPVPVYALGGVGAAQIPALRSAGARGIAVIRAVWAAPAPRQALAALLSAFTA